MSKVSIIVPCWGVEKYLDRCVESLINQTLREMEIILVDDESPDSVPEMCDEWAKKDNRIKVIHKKNAGLGMATATVAWKWQLVIILHSVIQMTGWNLMLMKRCTPQQLVQGQMLFIQEFRLSMKRVIFVQ